MRFTGVGGRQAVTARDGEDESMPTWMNRSKESEAARRADACRARQEAGNCIRCGFKRDPASKQLCAKHLKSERTYQLKRYHDGKRVKRVAEAR